MTDERDDSEGFDLGGLLRQAQDLQARLESAQEQAAGTVVEGVAGGGAVRIEMTAGGEFRQVSIDAGAVDPDDVAMLEDLVLAALRDAAARAGDVQAAATPDLPDLSGLGDLLGGGDPEL